MTIDDTLAKLPPGPYRVEWPAEQGGPFTLWGRQGTPPDFKDGWAIPLVASGVDTAMYAICDMLNASSGAARAEPGLPSVDEMTAALAKVGDLEVSLPEIRAAGSISRAKAIKLRAALEAHGEQRPDEACIGDPSHQYHSHDDDPLDVGEPQEGKPDIQDDLRDLERIELPEVGR